MTAREQLLRVKRQFIPAGSRREKLWIALLQAYRLYRRDGPAGLRNLARASLSGQQSLVPAWWTAAQYGGSDASEWRSILEWLNAGTEQDTIIIYAGTPYDETAGQRSYWLGRSFLGKGMRVLFVYWRFNDQVQEAPQIASPDLFELPMDRFWLHAPAILAQGRGRPGRSIFLVEMPHPSLFKIINLANANGWYTITDQIDDWGAFSKAGQASWFLPGFDAYLAANSDVCLASSQVLLDQLRTRSAREVHLLPNAYTPASLNLAQDRQPLEKGKLTLGYFGHLTSAWFDWELLHGLALKHPDWIIYLIGPGESPPSNLPGNIRLLGRQPHELLAGFAANWDAALIPFKVMELTRAVDPIKVYEYLAMGLPVVAAGMPHLQRQMLSVWSADTSEDFEKAILMAVSTPFDQTRVKDFLAENTWDERAERLLKLLPTRPGAWEKYQHA